MIRKKQGNIEWLEFELLANEPGIIHGVFLRHGGVSEESFTSLNVLEWGSDHTENVQKNRALIVETLKLEKLIAGHQKHGANVVHVTEQTEPYLQCDGLMTTQKNWGLMAMHADCQGTILYDPIHKAIATVHAGWRGQVQNIYREVICKMAHTFGTKPENLLVCISPSLGPQNSEFKHYRDELPEEFWSFQIKPTYFDLWAIAEHQLKGCGVLPHHLEIARIDTYANPSDFFSYRREKAAGRTEKITGSHGTVVALS